MREKTTTLPDVGNTTRRLGMQDCFISRGEEGCGIVAFQEERKDAGLLHFKRRGRVRHCEERKERKGAACGLLYRILGKLHHVEGVDDANL